MAIEGAGRRKHDKPGLAQYRRVHKVLASDAALSRKFGPLVLVERDGASDQFPKAVIELTEAIHAEGLNIYKLNKRDIMRRAAQMLILSPAAPVSKKSESGTNQNQKPKAAAPIVKKDTTARSVPAAPRISNVAEPAGRPKTGSTAAPQTRSGDVEFVENSIGAAGSTNSTNSPPGHTLEMAIIPADSLLEDYLRFAHKQLESADSFIIGAFLPVVAACLGRRVFFAWGQERIYPNLFSIQAGKSGDRKSTAINLAESVATAVLKPENFLPHDCSVESLFDEYDTNCDGSPDKSLIVDDANTLLGTWSKSGYGERVGRCFLRLYDCKSLSESFQKNKQAKGDGLGRRVIPETSTSVVLGATFDICRLQGRGISSGLQRRFLFYAAERHGRLITCPPPIDQAEFDRLVGMLAKLSKLTAECKFSDDAMGLWESYQRQNRKLLQSENNEPHLARLNGAPRQVQKVAMLFAAAVWAKQDSSVWDGIIHSATLELAIEHVDHCLQTAARLDTIAEKAAITTSADALLARVRQDFRSTEYIREGCIWLTKTHLTAKYAPHPDRPHSWKPDDLYLRLIPNLIERGLARLGEQQGKKVWYGFAVED